MKKAPRLSHGRLFLFVEGKSTTMSLKPVTEAETVGECSGLPPSPFCSFRQPASRTLPPLSPQTGVICQTAGLPAASAAGEAGVRKGRAQNLHSPLL